jgi:hypothetical protein
MEEPKKPSLEARLMSLSLRLFELEARHIDLGHRVDIIEEDIIEIMEKLPT